MQWLKNLKIGVRLGVAFCALLLLLVFSSWMGVLGVSRTFDGLKDMADNNVRPIEYLSTIAILNQRNSVLLQDMMLEPTAENLNGRNGELT